MEAVREYLIGVTAAALICALAARLRPNGPIGATIRLMTGIFMALAVVAPLGNISLNAFPEYMQGIQMNADDLVKEGENSAQQAWKTIITEQSQSYILDKAKALGVELTVEIVLSDEQLPIPVAVLLSGDISPYDKSVLGQYITDSFGIATEAQTWSTS